MSENLVSRMKTKSFVYTFEEEESSLMQMREEGLKRGAWVGFDNLDKIYSVKRGSTTYLIAGAHVGKTVFINELITNLIEFSNWNIVIWSVETGSPKDVMAELLWCYLKSPFLKNKKGMYASDDEVRAALRFLRNKVRVLDFGTMDVTVPMVYAQVERLKNDGFNPDMVIIDPFTEINTDSSKGVRDDIAIGNILTQVRRFSSKHDVHTLIAAHTTRPEMKDDKDVWGNNIRYAKPPTMNDISGGMQWSRKGYAIISLWRCPYGLAIPNGSGAYYEDNQTLVSVLKAKPKIMGEIGSCVLTYDKLSNRFFEADEAGNRRFSHDCPTGFSEREVSPNVEVYEQRELTL